jgi:nucleoside-triphosphatase THEP1
MEVTGMNGSGKTYFVAKILQERMLVRNTPEIIICTKPADATILKLGWPIVDTYEGVRKHRQCIFWPRTGKLGKARKAYHEGKIYDLLDRLWVPNSNRLIAFDEIAYVESLSPEIRDMVEMYWRESRALGITMLALKQRIQGANRHMSSETWWTVGFVPKDENDAERVAELFGPKRVWLPVFQTMNPDNHEFLIRHTKSRAAYISWVDTPLLTIPPPDEGGGMTDMYGGQR